MLKYQEENYIKSIIQIKFELKKIYQKFLLIRFKLIFHNSYLIQFVYLIYLDVFPFNKIFILIN